MRPIDNGLQVSGGRSITPLIVEQWFVAVGPAQRRVVRFIVPLIGFGIVFAVMIPARADTAVPPGSDAMTNLESGSTFGSVEVDDLREVPLIVIAVALAVSVGLVMSSLGPRGLAVLTAIGDRGR
jgi:hypothetical protein